MSYEVDERQELAAAMKAAELVERALRGEPFSVIVRISNRPHVPTASTVLSVLPLSAVTPLTSPQGKALGGTH